MIRKAILAVLTVTCLITFSGLSMAADKGNGRKGKYLFRKNCRSCHVDGGSAVSLSPISKTQAQWIDVFKSENAAKLSCADEFAKRSEKDLLDIFTYMHDHAYDSPSPAKCK